ncbi:MAG: EutP/PduV family microcompartment system protein [Propionibacteriaceae bacterium]|jgi:ethanolamine utilization protein EutP|nr:EutP/PduV family microcompartment system protein [Propionibacteriaceae bacterium]
MKRLMLIGSVGCGKTTFMQRLHGDVQEYSKTQTIGANDGIWDTPGEYMDSLFFKSSLKQTSSEVDLVVFLQAATVSMQKIPPAFTTFFPKPSIGVVTKIDLATPAQIAHARHLLDLTGVKEIYEVSSITGEGFDELLPRLE